MLNRIPGYRGIDSNWTITKRHGALKNRSNYKLGFGNLFKSKDYYFLCITPHCDCLRPSKINNEFYFIHGKEIKIETALKGAETGDYTFCIIEGRPLSIEWICKPFSSYISDEDNVKIKKIFSTVLKVRFIFSGKREVKNPSKCLIAWFFQVSPHIHPIF